MKKNVYVNCPNCKSSEYEFYAHDWFTDFTMGDIFIEKLCKICATQEQFGDNRYPIEKLSADDDDGTMPQNVSVLSDAVVGHKIVAVEQTEKNNEWSGFKPALKITLDNGKAVYLVDTDNCCAETTLKEFILNVDKVDHIITGVGTTGEYTTWHIYADMGDVLRLKIEWSAGNPFYYGYGFDIQVEEI